MNKLQALVHNKCTPDTWEKNAILLCNVFSFIHGFSLIADVFVYVQVIHQLKQLGTVWQDVLPVSIYCKAMGNLLNTAITEIITKIMMLEVCFFCVCFLCCLHLCVVDM